MNSSLFVSARRTVALSDARQDDTVLSYSVFSPAKSHVLENLRKTGTEKSAEMLVVSMSIWSVRKV